MLLMSKELGVPFDVTRKLRLGVRGTVNPGEVLIKAVMFNKPKMLLKNGICRVRPTAASESGLNQNGTWPGTETHCFSVADVAPPADRHNLTPGEYEGERSNPVVSPAREGELQGTLMRQRGSEKGGSEGRPVMGRIEGESPPTTSPRRESGLTSLASVS
jgi:hypothetical protein